MDEMRAGLIPSYRAIWAKKGQRPHASSRRKYQWVYDYAFVHPNSGEMVHYVCSTVDTDLMSAVLASFANDIGVGTHRQVILVLDGAGWHTSKRLIVPTGIHLVFLPPYSPELQPAERLFPLINEALANRTYAKLDDLKERLYQRIQALHADPLLVADHTRYHWWPADVLPAAFKRAS